VLKKLGRKEGSDSPSESGSDLDASAKAGRRFLGPAKIGRRCRKHAGKVINGHVHTIWKRLGIYDSRKLWRVREYSQDIAVSFTKVIHTFISEIMQLMVREKKVLEGVAGLCQLHKAVHQAALDQGRCRTAALLVPYTDPTARVEFGGDYRELAAIGSYQKTVAELRTLNQGRPGKPLTQGQGSAGAADAAGAEGTEEGARAGPKRGARRQTKGKDPP